MKHAPIPIPGRAPEDGVKAIFKTGEQPFTLSNYKGRYVVLLFYSGDWECKENIVAFENLLDKYAGAGCEVFGCSSDSTKVHQSWIRTPSEDGGFGGSLRIPLISDPSGGMSQKFDVYDAEEGTCRNAVVIIDDSGIVRHAMTTSLEHEETARNCLDIVAMLKQSKLSDSEVRNINARAESAKKKKTTTASSGGASFREMSPVHMDKGELEKCWDISTDPELNKVLNLAKMLGKTAPPPVVQKTRDPCFDISTDQIRRMMNPRTPVRSCRATLHRNLAGFTAQTLGKGQKTKIEGLVQRMMGVGQMTEDLTGTYHSVGGLNQRDQVNLFTRDVFANAGEIRLREPGTTKWTEGSGVFINNYENFLIWVNYRDQLRITSLEAGHDLRSVLLLLKRAMESIEEALKSLTGKGFHVKDGKFQHSEQNLQGEAFELSFVVEYPGFAKEGDKTLKSLGIKNGLRVQKYGIGDGVYEVSVESRAGDNVWTLVRRGLSGIDVLGQAEAEMKTKHNIKPAKQETKSF